MSQAVQAVQAPTRNVPDKCVDAAGHAEVFLVKMCTARSFADFCRFLQMYYDVLDVQDMLFGFDLFWDV